MDITILIPCLNEELALPYAIDSASKAKSMFEEKGYSVEILVSDNGSTDKSIEIATNNGCRVVNCPVKGYGNALIFGIKNAYGKYTIMGDADGSYDFVDAVPMIDKLNAENLDLVMGSRLRGTIEEGAMPKTSQFGNPLITGIQNFLYKTGFSDSQCGLRAFNTESIRKLNLISPGMEFASEMIVKAVLNDLKRDEVPIKLLKDKRNRPPHLKPWRDGWRHLKFMLMFSPNWLFLIPSFILIFFGVIMDVVLLGKDSGTLSSFLGLEIGDHYLIVGSFSFVSGLALLSYAIMIYAIGLRLGLRKQEGIFYLIYKMFTVEIVGFTSGAIFIVGFIMMLYYLILYTAGLAGANTLRGTIFACSLLASSLILALGSFMVAVVKEDWISITQHPEV